MIEHAVGMVTYIAPTLPILISSILTMNKLGSLHEFPNRVRSKERLTSLRQYQPFERWLSVNKKDKGWHGNHKGAANGARVKRDASITTLIFTAVYAVFNIPTAICYIFQLAEMDAGEKAKFFSFDRPGFYVSNFMLNLSIPLNSTVNPIVYLVRMRGFRNYLLIYLRKIFKYFRLPIYF